MFLSTIGPLAALGNRQLLLIYYAGLTKQHPISPLTSAFHTYQSAQHWALTKSLQHVIQRPWSSNYPTSMTTWGPYSHEGPYSAHLGPTNHLSNYVLCKASTITTPSSRPGYLGTLLYSITDQRTDMSEPKTISNILLILETEKNDPAVAGSYISSKILFAQICMSTCKQHYMLSCMSVYHSTTQFLSVSVCLLTSNWTDVNVCL